MKGTSLHDSMMAGNLETISEGIYSTSNLGRVLAIGACVKNNVTDPYIIDGIKDLKKVDEFEFCINVGCMATAALDVLHIEKYTGNDRRILDLIESKFSFVR